jgi:Tol biopolymer transport system component
MDSSGATQLVIPWEENWTFISSWLDNQRLLINDYDELSDGNPWLAAKEFSTFLAVNPFTGEQKLLQPDFPNIYSHHMFPSWTGFGSTVYNSTLDRVVYMRADSVDADFHYVLWDIDGHRSLADFKVFVSGQDIPRWSPGGEKFAIAFSPFDDNSDKWLVYNLYTVSRDGDVVKVTDLSEYYPWYYIGQHSWSPDGKYIAFWFSGWAESPQVFDLFDSLDYQHLAVVDTNNNDLSVFCISGNPYERWTASPPVWSPNGKQILIESPLSENHSRVLLFDLSKKTVAGLGNDMTPLGWMVAP